MFENAAIDKLKKVAPIAIVVLLIFTVGCNLWSFGKKDPNEEALKLKNKTDQTFSSVQNNAKEFNTFLTRLNKRWYSVKDVEQFASDLGSFQTKLSQDQSNIKQINANLSQLAELDRGAQFEQFIKVKAKAVEALDKSLTNSQKIVTALNPKIVNIAKLYTEVDAIKQAQAVYITALLSNTEREQQASMSRTLLAAVLAPVATPTADSGSDPAADTSTPTTTTPDSSSSTTTTDTTTDSSSTSSSSSSTELDPWVYQIAQNKWPSSYIMDLIDKSSDDFTQLYQDMYSLHKQINFNNSKRLLNYVAEVKNDNADFSASIRAIIENLREDKRLSKQRDRYNTTISSLQSAYNSYSNQRNNRPAGVSPSSAAIEGMDFAHQNAREEIERYKAKVRVLNKRIKDIRSALEGTLDSDYDEARWKYRGSLLALYKENKSISRNLMHETKRWKHYAIIKFVYYRLEHLAEAKYQNSKANEAYTEAKNKVATKTDI